MIDPAQLPDNPDLLRQMVVDLATQLEEHERRYQRVQNILEQLLRWRFGRKSEKVDERQMVLIAIQMEAEGKTAEELAAESGLDENDPLAPEKEKKRSKKAGHGPLLCHKEQNCGIMFSWLLPLQRQHHKSDVLRHIWNGWRQP